jgi:hypothetical protein
MEEEEYGDTTIQDNIDELGGHYTKWNKPETEEKYCMIPPMCEIKEKKWNT